MDRYSVIAELSADGTLEIADTIAAPADASTSFRRRETPEFFDRISFLGLTTTPSAGGAGVISLRYRIEGALAVEGAQRQLIWAAIPGGRRYEIGTATVTLRVAPGVALLAPSGMAEAGWAVTIGNGELEATRDQLPASEPGTIMALVRGERLPASEPGWQFDRARAGELAPAFLAGAAFILVVAAGAIVMLRWQGAGGPGLARQLRAAAVASIALGLVTGVIAELLLPRLGIWPQAIPAGLVVSGLLFGAAGLQTGRMRGWSEDPPLHSSLVSALVALRLFNCSTYSFARSRLAADRSAIAWRSDRRPRHPPLSPQAKNGRLLGGHAGVARCRARAVLHMDLACLVCVNATSGRRWRSRT